MSWGNWVSICISFESGGKTPGGLQRNRVFLDGFSEVVLNSLNFTADMLGDSGI